MDKQVSELRPRAGRCGVPVAVDEDDNLLERLISSSQAVADDDSEQYLTEITRFFRVPPYLIVGLRAHFRFRGGFEEVHSGALEQVSAGVLRRGEKLGR